jgi:hypothetical protein
MTPSREHQQLERLARRIEPQSTLLRAWPLAGGISAQMTALEVALPDGRTKKMIVCMPFFCATRGKTAYHWHGTYRSAEGAMRRLRKVSE